MYISLKASEDIIPAGNKKTRDKVITREFVQKKGKPFNKFLVRRSVERVYNLGFFDDVNVRMLPGEQDPNNVIIEIDVLEHKTGYHYIRCWLLQI